MQYRPAITSITMEYVEMHSRKRMRNVPDVSSESWRHFRFHLYRGYVQNDEGHQ